MKILPISSFRLACGSLVALVAAALVGSVGLNSARSGLPSAVEIKAPPGVTFVTVALGGFRGLLADILWVRSSTLQDEGRFIELAQLADWITRLEPRYPEVWSYHAWNMAYNVGAMFPDPQDRWRWIQNGLQLLRDEGIPANPGDSSLCWELGWLYADKVSGRWDEAGIFYRVSFAAEMNALLRGGRPDYETIRQTPQRLEELSKVGLDPSVMASVDADYGPLDWRLPESHEIYWGVRGRGLQRGRTAWCERLVVDGMESSFRDGSLFFDPALRLYVRGPRPDLAAKAVHGWLADLRIPEDSVAFLPVQNAIREAVVCLAIFGEARDAEAAYALLKRRVPEAASGSLKEFVAGELKSRLPSSDSGGREAVLGFLARGRLWKALGRPALGDGYAALARQCFDVSPEIAHLLRPEEEWTDLLREAAKRSEHELPEMLRKQ